ncbi:hypothetical protein ACGGZK_11490 [Agromyces sp. MMS24-K17]|uniref:hypothetical protein n=1 Tax=Agromyces sp. MMS24-K17 TaxID=3372850 RepID=UPI003753FCEA
MTRDPHDGRRAPAVAARFGGAIAAAALLASCTAPATPEARPTDLPRPSVATSTPTPTPEPEPADPLEAAVELVLRPERLELLDAEGAVVADLSYDADVAAFIAALTTALAAAPTIEEHDGSLETWPTTVYAWEGLQVADDHEGAGPIDLNLAVRVTTPVVGDGLAVRTVTGFQPGDDAEALAADLGEPWTGSGWDQVRAETGAPIGQQLIAEYENAYSVAVNTWPVDDGDGSWLYAPWNFGVGHV